MVTFKRQVDETTEVVKRTERLTFTLDGWEVLVYKSDGDAYRIHVAQAFDRDSSYRTRNRCQIYGLTPRTVDELEAFAKIIGPLLAHTAQALRSEGILDLRSQDDQEDDD